MSRKRTRSRSRPPAPRPAPASTPEDEALQGPPPAEALRESSDPERRAQAELALHHATSPELSGGDVDADWQRAASAGEEAVGGTVATPDQDVVDELGEALGVPREPDEEVRGSAEILDERDARRRHEPE